MKRINQVIIGMLAVAVLSACAGQTTAAPGAATSSPAAASVPASAPAGVISPASTAPSAPATTGPSADPVSTPAPASPSTAPVAVPAGKELTLHGTVEAGVGHGCLLLKDTTTGLRYNLTGGNAAVVKAGATLTVLGVIRKDMMSYCQQGQIFQVLTATAK